MIGVVLSSLLVPLAMVAELALGGPASVPAANVVAGQSAPANLPAQSDQARREVRAARDRVRRLNREIRRLDTAYKQQLAELDKLSRQRASWNRDRKISAQKADSQVTARRLSAAARQRRVARAQLESARRRLLAALDRELAAPPSETPAARIARLTRMRVELRRELRPKPRKIVVPDIDIDPSDDPDDLAEKARILARVEAQLRDEQRQLDNRFAYYSRQDRLRVQRERANEIDRTENTSVRRNPSGTGFDSSTAGAADAESTPEGDDFGGAGDPSEPSNRADSALEASSVVLADVVDDVTAGDLRRASRSTNPATRARAAERARDQVKARLEKLRRTRLAIERRARALRK
jgi:hypothetical protein